MYNTISLDLVRQSTPFSKLGGTSLSEWEPRRKTVGIPALALKLASRLAVNVLHAFLVSTGNDDKVRTSHNGNSRKFTQRFTRLYVPNKSAPL